MSRCRRVLGISPSGYYAWKKRGPSPRAVANAELLEEIRSIHEWSDGTYGAPRIHRELRARRFEVSLNRVARLMREAGLEGVSRRERRKTTRRDRDARPAPDLVDRDFTATGPDELWVADITYVPTWAGFVYLAVVLDAWSRRRDRLLPRSLVHPGGKAELPVVASELECQVEPGSGSVVTLPLGGRLRGTHELLSVRLTSHPELTLR